MTTDDHDSPSSRSVAAVLQTAILALGLNDLSSLINFSLFILSP